MNVKWDGKFIQFSEQKQRSFLFYVWWCCRNAKREEMFLSFHMAQHENGGNWQDDKRQLPSFGATFDKSEWKFLIRNISSSFSFTSLTPQYTTIIIKNAQKYIISMSEGCVTLYMALHVHYVSSSCLPQGALEMEWNGESKSTVGKFGEK